MKKGKEEFVYSCKKCDCMTQKEIDECSRLFSSNYGYWSKYAPEDLAGKRIKLSPNRYINSFVSKPHRYVAMVYKNEELIAHAFYKREEISKNNYITWVLQLVVGETYRGKGIATKLLQSIWGLTNDFAWGLYTSNPMTIKALEESTMRKINSKLIFKHLEKLKLAANDIEEIKDWCVNQSHCYVDTKFYADHTKIQENKLIYYPDQSFPFKGELSEGVEWLAFTFRGQKPSISNPKQLENIFEFSEQRLIKAYSSMDMEHQSWACHEKDEIDFLFQKDILKKEYNVLDIGCGTGRHSIELARRGLSVIGVDFSEINIKKGKEKVELFKNCLKTEPEFLIGDVRRINLRKKFDVVFCLYDVIGSFPQERENYKILKKIYKHLKPGGKAIISVMNMELSKKNCKNIISNIENNINKLLKLKPSNIMQKSGDVFSGDYMLIDNETGIVYRKEQFFEDQSLPSEFLIRDRRYSFAGIQQMALRAGFVINEARFMQAGKWDIPLKSDSKKAKEILLILEKNNYPHNLLLQLHKFPKTWL